jgi:hypothetical protein
MLHRNNSVDTRLSLYTQIRDKIQYFVKCNFATSIHSNFLFISFTAGHWSGLEVSKYLQKLRPTSPTCGSNSIAVVCLQTKSPSMYFYTVARVLTLVCIPNLEELIQYILKCFLLVYILLSKGTNTV